MELAFPFLYSVCYFAVISNEGRMKHYYYTTSLKLDVSEDILKEAVTEMQHNKGKEIVKIHAFRSKLYIQEKRKLHEPILCYKFL